VRASFTAELPVQAVEQSRVSHLRRHPELVKPHLPATIFALQVLQPAIGILLYMVVAALGWFVRPALAVGIFILVVGYYAWTSQGIQAGR
jgi:hypothetical protein